LAGGMESPGIAGTIDMTGERTIGTALRAVAKDSALTIREHEGDTAGFVAHDSGLLVMALDSGEWMIVTVASRYCMAKGLGAPALRRQLEVAGRPLLPLAPDLTIEGAPFLRVVA
jgi:hypothetical protein